MQHVERIGLPEATAAERRRMGGWWQGLADARRVLLVGLLAAAVLLAIGLAGCGSQAVSGSGSASGSGGKVRVAASFYAMADFAQKVGGDHVEVTTLVPAGTEPHDWEPSPQDMARVQDAKLLVYNGADMEHWVDDLLGSLGDQAPATVKASDGIKLRGGDEAGETDPHVWLNPEYAKREMANIRDALIKADPAHEADYQANYESQAKKLDELNGEFEQALQAAPNKEIVVSHEAFGYLCDAYGLTQVPITGMDAEGEPDAQTMAKIIDQVKEMGVKAIFSEDLVSPKVAKQIADATGAKTEVLNPLEGLTQEQLDRGEDYYSVMRSNLDKLKETLS